VLDRVDPEPGEAGIYPIANPDVDPISLWHQTQVLLTTGWLVAYNSHPEDVQALIAVLPLQKSKGDQFQNVHL
jgi:hypothetical protein